MHPGPARAWVSEVRQTRETVFVRRPAYARPAFRPHRGATSTPTREKCRVPLLCLRRGSVGGDARYAGIEGASQTDSVMIYYDSEFYGLGIFFRWQGSVLTSSKCAPSLRQRLYGGTVHGSQGFTTRSRGRRAKRSRPALLVADPAPVCLAGCGRARCSAPS